MYSPVARKYFHSEMTSTFDEKVKHLTQSNETGTNKTPVGSHSESMNRQTMKRHQSLPNVNDVKKTVYQSSSPINSLSLIDSDLQMMKVIQERDKINLELIKLQKMNKALRTTLNTERENFSKCKHELQDTLSDEKVKESLKMADMKYSINKKLAKQFKALLEEKEKQLEDLKIERDKMQAELEKKGEEVNTIRSECTEKGMVEEDVKVRIEMLEAQLNRAREISMSERKAAKEFQSELVKRERELKDLKIDLRIAQRSLKSAEESIKKHNEEGFEYASVALKEKEAVFNEEKEYLQEEIKKLRGELEKTQSEISEEKSLNSSVKSSLLSIETELDETRHKMKRLEHKYETLDAKHKTSEAQLKELKTQLENKEMNNEALKTACKDMDSQLDIFEQLNEDLRNREAALEQTIVDLKEEINKVKEELKVSRIELNEEKSLGIAAKSKLSKATKDLEEVNKEVEEWKSKTILIEEQFRTSEVELEETKEKYFMLEEDFDKLQRQTEMLASENMSLKEERSQLLTKIYKVQEKSYELEDTISRLEEENTYLHKNISDLQSQLSRSEEDYRQKEIKYESTVQQQSKLINFLQNHIDSLKKKKRTLAEKLLRSPNKENLDRKFLSAMTTPEFRQPNSTSTKALSLGKDARYLGNLPLYGENKKCVPSPSPAGNTKNLKETYLSKILKPESNSSDKQKIEPNETSVGATKEMSKVKKNMLPVTYKGEILQFFDKTKKLKVNCVEEIKDSLYLLGCDEGLFSLHKSANKQNQLVQIFGVSLVQQISLLKRLDIALMIAGESGSMMICNLRQLLSNVEAAECSKPSISVTHLFNNIVFAPDVVHRPKIEPSQLSNCHNFAVSPCNMYLCVASAGYITFLMWKTFSFQCTKQIKTEQPVSWFSFQSKCVFFFTDKIFRMELRSGHSTVEPLLDEKDSSLSFLNSKSRSGPYAMAVFEIVPDYEYLICFNTCGVFVNRSGKRSREDDIKWSHLPLAFVYTEPLLTIVHFTSVSAMKISPVLCSRRSNSSSSTINTPDIFTVEFTSLRLLGTGRKFSSIFLSDVSSHGLNLISFNPGYLFRHDPDVSLSAISSAISSSSCPDSIDLALSREIEALDLSADFSFSSSLNRSLENSSDTSASLPSVNNLPVKSSRQVRFHNVSTAM